MLYLFYVLIVNMDDDVDGWQNIIILNDLQLEIYLYVCSYVRWRLLQNILEFNDIQHQGG